MATVCYVPLKGRIIRLTRLDDCGAPLCGPSAAVVSKGFIRVAATANIEPGTPFKVKLADGTFCVNEKDPDLLNWYDLTVDLCGVDPALIEIAAGDEAVLDWNDDVVGFRSGDGEITASPVALEIWTDLKKDACVAGAPSVYGYVLFPMLVNGILGDLTVENGPVNFTIKGNTKQNPNWCKGPWDVVDQDGTGDAGPLLVDIGNFQRHIERTTIAPPEADCGYAALTCSDDPENPGTPLPAGSPFAVDCG